MKLYMTGVGILVSFLVFLLVAGYLCKKYKQSFWQLFNWLPVFVILTYFFGAYVAFVFDVGLFPSNYEEFLTLLSPHGFSFHFIGLLLGMVIAIGLFIKKIKRYETKKVWIDILFFSFAMAMIPMGFFLLLGDDFIGKTTDLFIGVRSLHADSQLTKFGAVYPVGIMISLLSLLLTILIAVLRRARKQYGLGLWGFILLLLGTNMIFFLQQYPRYGLVSFGPLAFDVKHHVSFLVLMFCLWGYYKWKRVS